MTARYYKQQSRLEWYQDLPEDRQLSLDQVQLGAVLRIADALELMAQSHAKLQEDRDFYERRYKEESASSKRLAHANAALRGHLKRMKRVAK